jgi:hypothetical protein
LPRRFLFLLHTLAFLALAMRANPPAEPSKDADFGLPAVSRAIGADLDECFNLESVCVNPIEYEGSSFCRSRSAEPDEQLLSELIKRISSANTVCGPLCRVDCVRPAAGFYWPARAN